jgi:hypothetical protein
LTASSAQKQAADRTERLRRAAHLRDTIVRRAQERGDSPADVARTMDMSVGHWYRVKKEPLRLASLTLDRVQAVAAYVGWPRVQVMVAIGWIQEAEVDQALSRERTVQDALRRLERGALVNGLATPLERASPDHRLLMARLLLLAEAALVRAPSFVNSFEAD